MSTKSDFLYCSTKVGELNQKLSQKNQYETWETAEHWLAMYEECRVEDPEYYNSKHVISVLLFAAQSERKDIAERVYTVWNRIRSLSALTELYYNWQDECLSEFFSSFCNGILALEQLSLEWVRQWQRWLTSYNLPKVAAGCAKAWCEQNKTSYSGWLTRFQIQEGSLLEQLIKRQDQINEEGQFFMEERIITNITVDYRQNGKRCKAVFENPNGITELNMPSFDPKSNVTLSDSAGQSYVISFKSFASLKLGDASALSTEERETARALLDGSNYSFIIENIHVTDDVIPNISYADATEHLLLGFPYLSEEIINGTEKGLWSHCGERVLMVSLENVPFELEEKDCSLIFTDYFCSENSQLFDPKPTAKVKRCCNSVFLCSIDSSEFNAYLPYDSTKSTLKGWFTISSTSAADGTNTTYQLPISLRFNNSDFFDPKNKDLRINKNYTVSIDFGTSSTCAAISTLPTSMIEMSMDEFGKSAYSIYENPTYLMLYQWEHFSKIWNNNETQPVLRKHGTGADESLEIYNGYESYSEELYDFGHAVKGLDITEQRCLDAIIQHLKMIPKMIEDGKTLVVRDYDNSDEVVLKCGIKGNSTFDPIEFFGYLLGKAINHPNGDKNQYFTKYMLSFPVKFTDTTRNIIRESLERGIRRSLPEPVSRLTDSKGNPLFQVIMKYSEPIDCVGAACGNELVLTDEAPCVLFGVFDFGGGTADYSFGMYRKADVDTEGYEEALELFGVDGDDAFGGEILIDKITYWILTSEKNKEKVINAGIPFEKPEDELTEDGFGNLIQSTIAARANVRRISEMVSRPFFEGTKAEKVQFASDVYKEDKETKRTEYKGSASCNITDLFSIQTNGYVSLDLDIEFDELYSKLETLFKAKCMVFGQSMEQAFSTQNAIEKLNKAGISDPKSCIKIIMAGNGSRHPMVRKHLEELFGSEEGRIFLIGENSNQIEKNRYQITPKTAVAIGALKLSRMKVCQPVDLSIIYVAVEKKSKLELVLNGDAQDNNWHRIGIVQNGEFIIYSSSHPDTENTMAWHPVPLDFEDNDEPQVCFIRRSENGRDVIAYIAVPIGCDPNTDEYDSEPSEMKLS